MSEKMPSIEESIVSRYEREGDSHYSRDFRKTMKTFEKAKLESIFVK